MFIFLDITVPSQYGKKMGLLCFIRHGQASFGEKNYDRLSSKGVLQVRILGEYPAGIRFGFDEVYCASDRLPCFFFLNLALPWRSRMTYAEFLKKHSLSRQDISRNTYIENRKTIRIKKEATALKNLDTIFEATLKIANKKGFQAMTMRDLSRETGMSMGSLYTYFASKEDLLRTLQHQHQTYFLQLLEKCIAGMTQPMDKLHTAIQTFLYLSEAMQPWFYFSFMETKNLSRTEKDKAVTNELITEKMIADILIEGQRKGIFLQHDPQLGAGVIKAMLQDWYLKRRKHAKRDISVDRYTAYLQQFVEAFFLKPGHIDEHIESKY
jgi:TetR/AcrR family transcriptional regulator, cholesterol catabolism regulator